MPSLVLATWIFRPFTLMCSRLAFLNHRPAALYRALTSIIPGRERFSWN